MKEWYAQEVYEAARMIASTVLGKQLPLVVCITGPTCSGKSTLAEALAKDPFMKSYHIETIRYDDYMRNADDPMMPRLDGKIIYDHPQAYHGSEFTSHVRSLMLGRNAESPVYDTVTNRRTAAKRPLKPPKILIAEGLFVFEMVKHLDARKLFVYLDVSLEVCLSRRIDRDTRLYAVTDEQVKTVFGTRVWPIWQPYGKKQKEMAEIIL
ncbi:AAA family ATPase [Candidatus Falkowbacteria bacterium]|nr:AAA family ATPase [Candidatus Falkowbacteria bacterium]